MHEVVNDEMAYSLMWMVQSEHFVKLGWLVQSVKIGWLVQSLKVGWLVELVRTVVFELLVHLDPVHDLQKAHWGISFFLSMLIANRLDDSKIMVCQFLPNYLPCSKWQLLHACKGLPPDVYTLVNHHKVAKEIWDRVKLLIEGTEFSLQERESKLYNEFDRFTSEKGK
ncbi:hypothetical protein Tco_1212395 [Tanacetum coccineum]